MAQTAEELKATKQAWYRRNKDRVRGQHASKSALYHSRSLAWQRANPEKAHAHRVRFRKSPAGREYTAHAAFLQRFKKHGITLDQYHAVAERQDFLCAICCEEPQPHHKSAPDGFHIDHNHNTGKVRELLCGQCNVAIGMLGDDPKLAMSVAAYLTRHAAVAL